ncbi:MAG TPA: FAD:protein FMN transferase [Gaiellaceae bacterium]|nr:FAD:protein FMN transferase [Gaiellaceae bacterium]
MTALPGVRRVEHVMGMPVIADVRDDGVGERVLDDVFAWFERVDAVFSTYRPESEISRLRRGELALADAHPDVRAVLDRCEELRVETGGYFDVRAASPDALDPSGLVKGWSVDRAAAILERAGARNFALNAGGDIRLRGRAVPAWTWRIGIQHPLEPQAVARVVESGDLAIATSGEYERGHHVFDPHTHRPPEGILSVTIVGPDLATADAYATAAFAMGAERAVHWTARLRGYEALTILADGRVLSTPGFPSVTAPAAA